MTLERATAPVARVWLLGLADLPDAILETPRAVLDAGERTRADRFLRAERRVQHVAAHALKRLVLAALTGSRPAALHFGEGPFGKPFLRSATSIDFSLSHCDSLVGVAVSAQGHVDLDLEPRSRVVDSRVVEGFFSVDEQYRLQCGSAETREHDRLRLWTLKAAIAKARGFCLVQGFDAVDARLDPPTVMFQDSMDDRTAWHLWQGTMHEGHVSALSLRTDQKALSSIVGEIDPCIFASCYNIFQDEITQQLCLNYSLFLPNLS